MARAKDTINIENYDRLEVKPNEVRLGDRICTVDDRTNRLRNIGEPVNEYSRNPRGCRGKTHIDKSACYDNIVPVTIIRKKSELLGERL